MSRRLKSPARTRTASGTCLSSDTGAGGEPQDRALPARRLEETQQMTTSQTQNIRDLRQWVCWRSEERDGKSTKIPYSPITGRRASSTNPDTWGGYPEAVRACRKRGYDGLGFVFTEDDPFCGVDLDGCLDPLTEEIEPSAWTIIEELDSYTEVSPSGTGVHILVRAALPEGRNRKGRFEAYDRGRYFTVTGRHLAGSPQRIENRQEELQCVVRRVFGEEDTNGHTKPVPA